MKKVYGILILSLVLVQFNKKEPDPANNVSMEINSASDLNGKCEFVNFHYDGIGKRDFTTCADIALTDRTMNKSFLLSFTFTNSGQKCTVEDKCNGIICDNYKVIYQPTYKKIIIGDINFDKNV
jgi:hypothetical protein